MNYKSDVIKVFQSYFFKLRNKGHYIQTLRSDNGGEYNSKELSAKPNGKARININRIKMVKFGIVLAKKLEKLVVFGKCMGNTSLVHL